MRPGRVVVLGPADDPLRAAAAWCHSAFSTGSRPKPVLIDEAAQLLGVRLIHPERILARAQAPAAGGQAKRRLDRLGRRFGQPEVALDVGRGGDLPAAAARLACPARSPASRTSNSPTGILRMSRRKVPSYRRRMTAGSSGFMPLASSRAASNFGTPSGSLGAHAGLDAKPPGMPERLLLKIAIAVEHGGAGLRRSWASPGNPA